MRARLVILLCLAASLLGPALVLPLTADAAGQHHHRHTVSAPRAGYGFADGIPILSLSKHALDRELDAVARTGARWLRVPFNWSLIEPRRGQLTWTAVDRVVKAATAHHLEVLADISYAPSWARSNLRTATAPPRDPALLGTFAARAVARFRHRVTHWEIWNEPNLAQFFGGPLGHAEAPENYTRLLKAAYPAIKRVQPDAVVVAAGIAHADDSATSYSPATFVRRMYAAGAHGSFDALALHPYVAANSRGDDSAAVYAQVTRVRNLMKAAGDRKRRIWFTELGNPTPSGGLTQAQQRTVVVRQLGLAADRPYVGPTFLYAIRDSGSNRADAAQNFGALLTHDFRPKLLAATLQR